MLRSRRLDTRGVTWLDPDTMELCSKALPVGHWPSGKLRAARQLYRLPGRSVEARKARNPRGTTESIYLLVKAFPVDRWPLRKLRSARQLYRRLGLTVEAGKVRHTFSSNSERVFTQQQRCGQRDN